MWTKILEALAAGIITLAGTCLPTGCGPMSWKIDRGQATGHVSTQYTLIGWSSSFDLYTGPKGEVVANAEGTMQGNVEPKPEEPVTP